MIEKPPHGSPCNGCGQCCEAETCPLGMIVCGHSAEGPCPALEPTASGFGCGIVLHPERYAPFKVALHGKAAVSAAAGRLVGVGLGCDAQLDGEPRSAEFDRKLRAGPRAPASAYRIFDL